MTHETKIWILEKQIKDLEQKLRAVEKERDELRDKIENYEYPTLKAANDQLLADAKVMVKALNKLKPEKDCPFCSEMEPCGHCFTMAAVQGRCASALSTPTAKRILPEKS